jgi:hypothetical protein
MAKSKKSSMFTEAMKMVRVSPNQSERYALLKKYTDRVDPERETLRGIFVQGGTMTVTDGFTALVVKNAEPLPEGLQGLHYCEPSKDNPDTVKAEPMVALYPELNRVLPSRKSKPALMISMDPERLMRLLEQFVGCSRVTLLLRTCNDPVEFVGYDIEDGEFYGLIMPMHDLAVKEGRVERPEWVDTIQYQKKAEA